MTPATVLIVFLMCVFGTLEHSIVQSTPWSWTRQKRLNNVRFRRAQDPCTPKPDNGNKTQPNIIFIVADDVGWNDVPWHNSEIYAPNLRNLAMQGIRLKQSYLMPLCSPSRAALLTGVYPFRSGMQGEVVQALYPTGLPLKYPTMANELKTLGYSTHAIGKWNQGFCDWKYTPTYRGFDTFFGFYQAVEHYYTHSSYMTTLETNGRTGYDLRNNTDVAWEYYGQHNSIPFVKQAEQLIKSHNTSKPFFLYFASPLCHIPHEVPRRFDDLYKNSNIQNFFRRGFMARVSALDEDIGRIIEALKVKGLYENSVIAFTSDNGASTYSGGSNHPLRGGKSSLYEGGTKVPGFFHSPKLIKGAFDYHGMMHAVDWLPTFLSIAGGVAAPDIDGVSAWDAMTHNQISPRTEFFYNIVERGNELSAAIRRGNWKLIVGKSGVPRSWYTEEETKGDFVNSYFEYKSLEYDPTNKYTIQLFDLQEDPNEWKDVSSSNPDKVRELLQYIEQGRLQSVPVVPSAESPAGDPALFGGAFTPGWCTPIVEPRRRA